MRDVCLTEANGALGTTRGERAPQKGSVKRPPLRHFDGPGTPATHSEFMETRPGGEHRKELAMFYGMYDREKRARRYRSVAAEYTGLSKDAADPFLRSYYLRIAEDYFVRAQGELRILEREKITAIASAADMQSREQQLTS
jgi:hypothetical protein